MSPQDVAVKVFSKQEYSAEVIESFKQEVLFLIFLTNHCCEFSFGIRQLTYLLVFSITKILIFSFIS